MCLSIVCSHEEMVGTVATEVTFMFYGVPGTEPVFYPS